VNYVIVNLFIVVEPSGRGMVEKMMVRMGNASRPCFADPSLYSLIISRRYVNKYIFTTRTESGRIFLANGQANVRRNAEDGGDPHSQFRLVALTIVDIIRTL